MENWDDLFQHIEQYMQRNDLIIKECEDCEVLIDEEKLIMNANAGGMEQIVIDAMQRDPLPKNFY